ncbi:MAG: hypothetical protein KGH54_01355 [Candidatus Micrarchaeota archaeon]|nr:hypothetical protein [Candidatus Micrarchaeota archaeon]
MSSTSVERHGDEPTVKPLSHSERYGLLMAKAGYDQNAAQERAEQNLRDGAKISSLSLLNERLRTGDHSKEADKGNADMVKSLKDGLRGLSGSKKKPKKVKS